ncbi:hypothetical protein, partial [Nonomuraea sp. NPDC005501]|uniref:hypothetical protein n=1 Tax=Nonomuraea sp. NPDC005501 TaxID=3156884 RepID=UPI0033A283D0
MAPVGVATSVVAPSADSAWCAVIGTQGVAGHLADLAVACWVLVVEHDRDLIELADHVVDLGPG